MKTFKNKWVKGGAILLGAVFALYLSVAIPEIWRSYKWQKSVEDFQNALEKPYREDVYGGKTPEETWTMFLDALKRGDIDSASRYYDVEHQGKAREWLEKLINDNRLEQSIKEMERLRKSRNKPLSEKKIYYSYDFFSEKYQQKLTGRVIFYLNPYTKVWKIIF